MINDVASKEREREIVWRWYKTNEMGNNRKKSGREREIWALDGAIQLHHVISRR